MTHEAPQMDDQFRRSLRRVVDHFWSDALEDYHDRLGAADPHAAQPDHIFESLAALMGHLDGTARGAQDYVGDLEKGSSWGDIRGYWLNKGRAAMNVERGLWRLVVGANVATGPAILIVAGWANHWRSPVFTGREDAITFLVVWALAAALEWSVFYGVRWIVEGFHS